VAIVTTRIFWPVWLLAAVTTGLVAGFMLGHALILGRFLDWMLASDPRLLATTYPTFASSTGSTGLTVFYAICGLQVITALVLLALALGARRHRPGAAIAGLTAVLWPILHYASGFGAVEAVALRSATPVTPDVAAHFLAWNAPVHTIHAALLVVGLIALLAMPLTAVRRRPDR
jgi:glucan phosphoethanolaminetransferase (alkaline phosphatase superfamily)